MKIFLKKDHRLFSYQKEFGSTTKFLPTLLVDAGYLDVQPPGNVMCTCYTACNIASAITGTKYDIIWLWTQMVQLGKTSNGGASPQDAFDTATKGLKNVFTGEITKPVIAYFQVETGQYDFFTNVKSAIQMEYNKGFKRPVGIGTVFYPNWANGGANIIFSKGLGNPSDHEWEVCGWDEQHPNCFQMNWWGGFKDYITQDDFNKAMDATYGSVALTFAVTTQEKIDFLKEQNYSRIQGAIDKIYNILKPLVDAVTLYIASRQPTPPVIETKPIDDYQEVKEAIQPKYLWDNKQNILHSMRLIGDEESLSVLQKDLLCDVCGCESGFNIHAKLVNSPTSIDRGLFQWNNKYHPEITDDIAYDPEKTTRLACKAIKNHQAHTFWSASEHCWNKTHKYDSILT